MLKYRMLEYPSRQRAQLMIEFLEELDRSGAQAATTLLELLTADGRATDTQVVRLLPPLTLTTGVLVAACAELQPSDTPRGSHVFHRLLVIPGTHHVWHFTRAIPSPDAIGEREAAAITRLDEASLAALLELKPLGVRLTVSFCDTTQVA